MTRDLTDIYTTLQLLHKTISDRDVSEDDIESAMAIVCPDMAVDHGILVYGVAFELPNPEIRYIRLCDGDSRIFPSLDLATAAFELARDQEWIPSPSWVEEAVSKNQPYRVTLFKIWLENDDIVAALFGDTHTIMVIESALIHPVDGLISPGGIEY